MLDDYCRRAAPACSVSVDSYLGLKRYLRTVFNIVDWHKLLN